MAARTLPRAAAGASFTVYTNDDGDFYVAMPDGSETDDWSDADAVEVFGYAGRMYVCAGAESGPVRDGLMVASSVYGLGTPYATRVEEYVPDAEDLIGESADAPVELTDEDEDGEEDDDAGVGVGDDVDDDDDDDDEVGDDDDGDAD